MPCRYEEYGSPKQPDLELHGFLREAGLPFMRRGTTENISDYTDRLATQLCLWFKNNDPTSLSLEAQIWWRDHQKADRERDEREKERIRTREICLQALAKLTDEERKALGV